jgi:circadian clock protein KaiB
MVKGRGTVGKRGRDAPEREAGKPSYELVLYIISSKPPSLRAIRNIKQICAEHLKGRHTLKIIDIAKDAVLAAEEQIVAVPTLVKKLPLPQMRLVGDMSDSERVLEGLNVDVG